MALPVELRGALPISSDNEIEGLPVTTTIYPDESAFTHYDTAETGERQFVHSPDLVGDTWRALERFHERPDIGILALTLSHIALIQHGHEVRLSYRERMLALGDTEGVARLDRLTAGDEHFRKYGTPPKNYGRPPIPLGPVRTYGGFRTDEEEENEPRF